MTAAPRTTQPHTHQGGTHPLTRPLSDLERFLSFIYREQEGGYFEVCYIVGDPSKRKHADGTHNPESDAERHSWHPYHAHTLPLVAELITMLAEQYGDVYVSRTCYTHRKRNKAYAMPSRALVVDDAPADADFTFSIQTSKHKRHGWCILDRALDVTAMEELAQRAAYALNADKGGWDITQLVRVPGTYNTKGGERWAVRYMGNSRRTYTVDELRQRYPACNEQRTGKRGDFELDADVVDFYRRNHRALLGADGVPRRLSDKSNARRIQHGGIPSDRSQARWDYILSCILHRMTNEEIVVHAETFCDWGHSDENGTAWLDTDIRDCLRKLRGTSKLADKKPLLPYLFDADDQADEPSAPVERVIKQPARRGRPAGIDADAYYATLNSLSQVGGDGDEVIVVMTVGELAKQLKISRRKVATLEAQLRGEGRISERRRANKNHSSYLVLTPKDAVGGTAKNTETAQNAALDGMQKIGEPEQPQEPVYRIPALQNEASPVAQEEHTPVAIPPAASPPVGDIAGVSFPPAAAPSLAAQFDEALAVYGDVPKHRRKRMVLDYIATNYAPPRVSAFTLGIEYQNALDRCFLRTLAQDALYKEQRKRQRMHDREMVATRVKRTPGEQPDAVDVLELVTVHAGNAKRATKFGYALARVEAELLARKLPLEQPRMKRKKAKPTISPEMQRYIDLATPEPDPIPLSTPPPSYDVAGMVQRLKALNIKQQKGITP